VIKAFKFAVKGEVRLKVVTQKVMRNSLEVKFEIQVGTTYVGGALFSLTSRTPALESRTKTDRDFLRLSTRNRNPRPLE